MTKKIALITGATAGIGLETARILAKNSYNLILTGRRKDRLEELKAELSSDSVEIELLQFDVRSKLAVDEALASLPADWKKIDLLVNNAGLAAGMDPVNNADVDDWEQMIDTNVKGLLYVTRTVSNWMIDRQSGHIISISSIAGKEAYPMGSVYCGTKHAVSAISKAMRIELAPHNIKVSTVCPGAVETEFSLVRFKGDEERASKVYDGFTPLFAKDIAETIYFVVSRPAHVNIDDILVMPTAQASARDFVRK
ncbi:SDR family NAD(P)-dependent oxidoreductase [Mangrovibacterium lignilyticum]|uniref:SDR family NAD(P)-dependent oxidoreductase n=1 Tax=Mangrovibacterium lignilyticum TaxID=2668052 RepID=UPI0013D26ED4|nr:SDR family NAD(P)-dependent oxidoreductase [Mangrovibacterium lignilyticum]